MSCIYFIYYLLAALGLCCRKGFSLVVVKGGCSWLWYTGFSLHWLLVLWSAGISSCGRGAQ